MGTDKIGVRSTAGGTIKLCKQENNAHICRAFHFGYGYMHDPGVGAKTASLIGICLYYDDPYLGSKHKAEDR